MALHRVVVGAAALHRVVVGALVALAWLCVAHQASARRAGIGATGCDGCHSGGKAPEISITANVTTVALSQMVTLTINVSATNGAVAGFYVTSDGVGSFQIVDTGTRLEGTVGVTHNAPRTGSGGQTTFTVGWTAPTTLGGVIFSVYAISANGDGRSSGDGPGSAVASFPIGCAAGTKYYRDFDGDGYGGLESGSIVSCTQLPLYAKMGGDCDDNSEVVNPGTKEVCDGRDNDCNGQIDDNLTIATYCEDADGDGHGSRAGKTVEACGPSRGFGLCDNDCNDNDKTIYPGAMEVCNNRDDNCTGGVDENARVECGLGWCRRYGAGCNATSVCTPGKPMRETCNLFDDDCDGVNDNGTNLQLCGDDELVCNEGRCVAMGALGDAGRGGAAGSTGGSSGSAAAETGGTSTTTGGADTGGDIGSSKGSGPTGGDVAPGDDPAGGCALATGRAAHVTGWSSAAAMVAFGWALRRRASRRRSSLG